MDRLLVVAGNVAYRTIAVVALVFLLAPIVAIIPLGFSSGSLFVYPMPGLSLRWFVEVLDSPRWMGALGRSLALGAAATALSVVLGTLGALGLARARGTWVTVIKMLVLAPMIVPVILVAVAAYFFLAPLALNNTWLGIIVAHTVIAVPFVLIPVLTALELQDPNLARASASCGASPATTFRRVTLPSIKGAVASGALFAFATSFDDVVIALFLAGPAQRTLPQEMFSGLRDSITPAMVAVGTLMIAVSTLLYLMMLRVQRNLRKAAMATRAGEAG